MKLQGGTVWGRLFGGVLGGVIGLNAVGSAQSLPESAGVAVSVVELPMAVDGAVATASCESCPPAVDVFKKVPPTRPVSRLGHFPILPTGRGYYSALDQLRGECAEGPPKYPYPRTGFMPFSFYDADFKYLDDPKNTEHDAFDPLKRVRLGDNWLFSTGGQIWNRSMNEYNSRLTANDNNYNLTRVRTYADLWYKDDFRFYAEFIGAYSVWQDLPKLGIDETGPDFLNLFVDLHPFDIDGKPVYVRLGRQEMAFGSQRLISSLDWANTRRTFQGVRAFRQGEKFDLDLFWVQPVLPAANKLDSGDNNQNFVGAWGTYRPKKGHAVDAYYLMLDNTNDVTQQGIGRSPITTHTLGGRYSGDRDGFLWDFEGAMQFGRRGDQDIVAGMATAGLGYHWKEAPLTPTVWLYYDYASGSKNPGAGDSNTFTQLFPFGHYYLGWADVVGRQNIHDFNVQAYFYPTRWLTTYVQYHRFFLASGRDALYNIAGNATRRDPTGAAGTDVGRELDVVLNFHLTKHADLSTGYSYLFGGEFLRRTAGRAGGVDTSTAFVQMSYRW